MKRPLHRRKARGKITLRATIAFARKNGRWPAARELARARPSLGSAATVQRTLVTLRGFDLVEMRGKSSATHWNLTDAGFEFAGRAKFRPVFERIRSRADAASLLASPQAHKTGARISEVDPSCWAALPVYD